MFHETSGNDTIKDIKAKIIDIFNRGNTASLAILNMNQEVLAIDTKLSALNSDTLFYVYNDFKTNTWEPIKVKNRH